MATLKKREFKSGETPNWKDYWVPEVQAQLEHAKNVHNAGVTCLGSLFEVFSTLYGKKTGGGTSNQQQDVLRSMLVFAGATLDGTLKYVIRGALSDLASAGSSTLVKLQAFINKQLLATRGASPVDTALMARAFTEKDPKSYFLAEYAEHLTRGSLQSAEALITAHDALGFDLGVKKPRVKEALESAFQQRNRVIHELDYNENRTNMKQRLRHQCSKPEILSHVDLLLAASRLFLDEASARLA